MIIFLVKYKPMETQLSNTVELINEFTIISLLYMLYGMTETIRDPEQRNDLGQVYVTIGLANIVFHFGIQTAAMINRNK